jgi:methyltransferase
LARLSLALVVFAAMAVEAARAAGNERRQLWRGGREPSDDVYAVMRLAYPAAFLAMLLEQHGGPPRAVFAAGAALFAVGKALKWWAILTLGRAWTFRVIVVPGAPRVTAGPYRFLRHPNYAGVVGELVGVALMTGALVTGPIVCVLFGLLLKKRIIVEAKALERGLVTDRHV